MFIESEIVKETRHYVEELLGENYLDDLPYHNLQHTQDVVKAVLEIGEKSDLNEEELEMVILSAWLHDTGYRYEFENHEQESKKIAGSFLADKNYSPAKIETVLGAIEATRMPQSPKDAVAEVLCDADLRHLAETEFTIKSILLKKEREAHDNEKIKEEVWVDQTLSFINKHQYFTNYGKLVLEPKKEKNFKKLKKAKKKLANTIHDIERDKYVDALELKLVKLKNQLDREKELKPTRGIETMFRTTSRNHLTLSGMADNKANIMISVNAIILSIVLTVLFRKFGEFPNLIIPGLVLLATCLTTIIFSILATRPNVSQGTFTAENIKNKETNLLFFGNFHRMNINDYLWGMREMMKDGDYLYGSLIKDIYYLGAVLGKKYKMLRISYTIFMFGLILSIILFVFSQIYPAFFIFTDPGQVIGFD